MSPARPAPQLRPPGWLRHLGLLWSLRFTLAANRARGDGRAVSALSFLASIGPAFPLAGGAYALLSSPVLAGEPVWERFWFTLITFSCSFVWCAWPVLAAGVDDHSEVSRYAAFPISPLRLLVASTLADFVEPLAIVVYAPVLGATLAWVERHPPASWPMLAVALLTFLGFCAAWGRVGLHLVLIVLRQKRSAEAIGGGFLVVLALASLIPPVDTSWLSSVATEGVTALQADFVADAALALTRFPTGWYFLALKILSAGSIVASGMVLCFLAGLGAVGLWIAYRLLLRFHRAGSRGDAVAAAGGSETLFVRALDVRGALLAREVLELWRNPKARLLAAVPFLVAIALRLLSALPLGRHLLGAAADVWLLAGLSIYGSVAFCAAFATNLFGYDGRGLAAVLAAPVPLVELLRARVAVLLGASALVGLGNVVFCSLYFGAGGPAELALAAAGVLGVLPVLVGTGCFVSLRFPVRFHASLKRRDQPPIAATLLATTASAVGVAPTFAVLRALGRTAPGPVDVGLVVVAALAAWGALWLVLPRAGVELERRAEAVLQAITRD